MTRGQSIGCFVVALGSAAFALVSLIMGVTCLAAEGLWNCAALLTIVPGGLLVIAFGAGLTAFRSRAGPADDEDFGFTRIEGGVERDTDDRLPTDRLE